MLGEKRKMQYYIIFVFSYKKLWIDGIIHIRIDFENLQNGSDLFFANTLLWFIAYSFPCSTNQSYPQERCFCTFFNWTWIFYSFDPKETSFGS